MPRRAPAYIYGEIPYLKSRFSSANEALGYLKSLGMGVRRQNFLRAWGAHDTVAARAEFLPTSSPEQVHGGADFTPVERRYARGYQYNGDVLVRDPSSGELFLRAGSAVFPQPVSVAEAMQEIVANLSEAAPGISARGTPIEVVGMGGLTSLLQLVGEEPEGAEFAEL